MSDAVAAARGSVGSADGTAIAWFREDPAAGAGPPDASRPALVLVHGATADHSAFRVVGPLLAASRRVLAIDRRGRGASGDRAPYAIEREYEDLARVVDWLAHSSGGPVDVMGHSFGGRVGLGAARLTSNLRRLVVYEGAPAPAGQGFHDPALLARLDDLAASGDLEAVMVTFMTEVVRLPRPDLEAYRRGPTWSIRVAAAATAIRELRAEAGPGASLDVLAEVHIPVLQIVGGASPDVFVAGTRELDARLANGRIAILAGQRHAAHHTAPTAFVAAVEAFLDGSVTIAA
ncbi:MAG: alpha/beta fold hydrolase [Candidatus Limnocylindrales bacterium]